MVAEVGVDVHPLAVLEEGQAKIWVMIVGSNSYQDSQLQNLNFAVADCLSLAAELKTATRSFPNTEFYIHCEKNLEEPAHSGETYLGETIHLATLDSIAHTLETIATQANPQDTVIFYFSGHGILEPDNQQLYLCLTETQKQNLVSTALPIQQLLTKLRESEVGKQVIILDACHSGTVVTAKSRGVGLLSRSDVTESSTPLADPRFSNKLHEALDSHKSQVRDFYALLACEATQQSWELPELQHGAFTYYLIKGIQGDAADAQGTIEIDRLYNYVRTQTEQHVHRLWRQRQTPGRLVTGHHRIVIGKISRRTHFLHNQEEREKDYRNKFIQQIEQCYPIDKTARDFLHEVRCQLRLTEERAKEIEQTITTPLNQQIAQYQQELANWRHQHYPIADSDVETLRTQHGLIPSFVELAEAAVEEDFAEHKIEYLGRAFAILHQDPPGCLVEETSLHHLQQTLGFGDRVVQQFWQEAVDCSRKLKKDYKRKCCTALRQRTSENLEARLDLAEKLKNQFCFSHHLLAQLELQAEKIVSRQRKHYAAILAHALRQRP